MEFEIQGCPNQEQVLLKQIPRELSVFNRGLHGPDGSQQLWR
jgi:hypothetical protein